jgi:phosphoenolpyruvate phosphomutase
MGTHSLHKPKCLTRLDTGETILSRQLRLLLAAGVKRLVISTGPLPEMVEAEAAVAAPEADIVYVWNPEYRRTNYIYSIYLAREHLRNDILLLHGDLVFDDTLLPEVLTCADSGVTVFPGLPLPEKDFKAVTKAGKVSGIGISFFTAAVALQPLYLLRAKDWRVWAAEIENFVARGRTDCYAEDAFNQVSDRCSLLPLAVAGERCLEIDTPEDLARANLLLAEWGKGNIIKGEDGN